MLDELKNILFQNRDICYLCKEKIEDRHSYICIDCSRKLESINAKSKIGFDYISDCYYSLSYNRYLRDKMSDYKFNGKNYLYKAFGEIMIKTARELGIHEEIDLIMFVPSHRRKESVRGYNQAQLLAKYISISLNIALSRKNLIKVKNTREQSGLNRMDRMLNLHDSFKIKDRKEINSKKILLIDDIITTGVTLEECSKVLLNNGAKKVVGLTLTSSKI